MGTSISHRSPSTPNWKAAQAAYVNPNIGIDRITQEVWRAAVNQPIGNLGLDLSALIVSKCLEIATQAASPHEASKQTMMTIALSGQASLAADLAQRAAVNTSRKPGDRVLNFVCTLFSEAADYLVSRDLPSYVGYGERLRNVSDSLSFKNSIREHVESTVREVPIPRGIDKDPEVWRTYVQSVLCSLAGGK